MATVQIKNNWVVEFTQKEFVLLLRFLGNRASDAEWREADALCDKLTQARVNQTREMIKQMDALENSLQAKLDAEANSVTN